MSTQAPIPTSNALAYLRDMESLEIELRSAMLAISGNRLAVLEESLWRQQILCTSLKHLSHSLAAEVPEVLETPLRTRIRQTGVALQQLNRTYAALVQQSSQSTDTLLRLCSSFRETAPSPSITAAQPQSWSCEA